MSNLWYKNAVFYELYLRAFRDGNGDGHGDFKGLLEKVDYLKALGVDCVWLLPFYPSPLFDDGYDISDFYNIHSQYGTMEDFKTAVNTLHDRGIKVIADLVLNHTSEKHPWFIESRSSRESPKRNWYVWSDTDGKYQDARIIFLDTENSNWTFDEESGQYYWHRFYAQQPDLNYDNPEVRAEMIKVLDFWMSMGLDGFRADAVPYLFEREGTNCENLTETHQFLKELRAHMDKNWPGKVLLAEANQWPEDTADYFGDGDEFHMGFHFPIMPRLYMALKQHNRKCIVDILNQTPGLPPGAQWCVFLRNHDELTLEMVTPDEREFMWNKYAPNERMRLNLGIRRRLAPLLDNDRRRIDLMNGMLFSLPGSPIIYYGDEIGMGDNIWLHDRNGVRTPMQWDEDKNAGFSDADETYIPVIDDEDYGYKKVNVQAQLANPNSIYHNLRFMIAIRRQYQAFSMGDFRWALPVDNTAILGYWRTYKRERILVMVNFSEKRQHAHLDLSSYAGKKPISLFNDAPLPEIADSPYRFILEPYAFFWLKI